MVSPKVSSLVLSKVRTMNKGFPHTDHIHLVSGVNHLMSPKIITFTEGFATQMTSI